MRKNVGTNDRIIRLLLGFCLFAAGIAYHSWWGALGLIPLVTGTRGSCPLYAAAGINTRKKKS